MTKKKALPTPIILIALVILSLLLVASILGENARSEQVTKDYFNAISTMKYNQVEHYLSQENSDKDQGFEHLFALETALQKHFGLAMNQAYMIEAKQQTYWLPYTEKNKVKVALRLSSINKTTKDKETPPAPYLDGLVELIRESGRWRIVQLDLPAAIKADYQHTRTELAKQQHIEITPTQLKLHKVEVSLKELDPISQKLWLFQLNSALETIANATPK